MEFEDCMIKQINDKKSKLDPKSTVKLNATDFCVNYYAKTELWETKYPSYIQRKHECLAKTGVDLGKSICDEMFVLT